MTTRGLVCLFTARRGVAMGGLSLVLLVGACAQQQAKTVDFSDTARGYSGRDYPAVRETWTRHGRIPREATTGLELWAVLKSADFRHAYVERYSEVYALPDGERVALRQQQLAVSREILELHMTVQTLDWKWNDLEKKNSPWRVTLIDGAGVEISPTTLEVVKLPVLYETEFFPTRNDFTKTYLVRFKAGDEGTDGRRFSGVDTGRLALRVLGPFGRTELVWSAR